MSNTEFHETTSGVLQNKTFDNALKDAEELKKKKDL